MSDASGTPGPRVVWDRSKMHGHVSTIASASSATDQIVLNFGVRQGPDKAGTEQGVSLTRRIVLQPMTAKHLHDMLSRLLAEATTTGENPG